MGQIGLDIAELYTVLKNLTPCGRRITLFKYRREPGKLFFQGGKSTIMEVTTRKEEVPEIGEFDYNVRIKMKYDEKQEL